MALTAQFSSGQTLTAAALNASTLPIVTSTADITSPFTNQIIFNSTDGLLYKYTGSLWVALAYAAASSAPGDSGTVTSASYTGTRTGTANICGIAFKAPASGKVRISWAAEISNSGANATYLSFDVKTGTTVGSGVSTLAAADARSVRWPAPSSNPVKLSDFHYLSGLTPGSDYNVALSYKVAAGTGTYNVPHVLVESVF